MPRLKPIEIQLEQPMGRMDFIRWRMEVDGVGRSTVQMRLYRRTYRGIHIEMTPEGAKYFPGPGPLVLDCRARPAGEPKQPLDGVKRGRYGWVTLDEQPKHDMGGVRCACGKPAWRMKSSEPVCRRCDEWEQWMRQRDDDATRHIKARRRWVYGHEYKVHR
jgi:hypothetical protein